MLCGGSSRLKAVMGCISVSHPIIECFRGRTHVFLKHLHRHTGLSRYCLRSAGGGGECFLRGRTCVYCFVESLVGSTSTSFKNLSWAAVVCMSGSQCVTHNSNLPF